MSTTPRAVLRPVRPEMAVDEVALLRYLQENELVDARAPSLEISQFGHGQSNPTYLIKAGSQELVLRKQPPGKLLPSAHAVGREHRVMHALAGTPVQVPEMLSVCTDTTVIGTEFYLMSFIDGQLFLDPSLPTLTAAGREMVYHAMSRTLAQLHTLDPNTLALSSFGKPHSFCTRQVATWTHQYQQSTGNRTGIVRLPEMQQLAQWLKEHAAAADAAAGPPCIVHGDFRLDNLVMHAQRLEVEAVLDWELATLGNPMSDLAYNCLAYHLPASVSVIGHLPTPLPQGVPSENTYISWYCEARGIPTPAPADWAFFVALSIFRAAAILAGVHTRALTGNASSSAARSVGAPDIICDLANTALRLASSASGSPFASARRSSSAVIPSSRQENPGPPRGLPQTPKLPQTPPGLSPSPSCAPLLTRLRAFMRNHVSVAAAAFHAHAHSPPPGRWQPFAHMESLKAAAQGEGLWNLWISPGLRTLIDPALAASGVPPARRSLLRGPGLSNLDYAHLAREMGRVPWAPEVFNCSAPDTGNMEVLARYGSPAQQRRWLLPLLGGEVRSAFAMTEPDVASSDATNVQGSIKRAGGDYIVHGRKWWISGACDSRCKVAIFMGKSNPSAPMHAQQSMILVPMDTPGVSLLRAMTVFGEDDAPHGHAEMEFNNVRVPASNVILGEGRGFEIAQGRLGPGRLHHCMRACGVGEAALEIVSSRVQKRRTFGQALHQSPLVQAQLAEAWLKLHGAWLGVLHAAHKLDEVGNKDAKLEITAAKVMAPKAVLDVLDVAIQLHGAAGVGQDTRLAELWGAMRTLRIADGPDEVHLMAIGKQVIKRASLSKL